MYPYAFLFKKLKPPSCPPPAPPPTLVGTHLIQSTSSKNYLKWWETWQLDSCAVDNLEGKELV